MAEQYINSNLMKIYPSAYRGEYTGNTGYAKLTTESSITNIIKSLCDKDNKSFVFSPKRGVWESTVDNESTNVTFEIILSGYYFSFDFDSIKTLLTGTNLYVAIKYIDEGMTGEAKEFIRLCAYDDNDVTLDNSIPKLLDSEDNKFKGLVFSDTAIAESDSGTVHIRCLHLLEKNTTTNKWSVPIDSFMKVQSASVFKKITVTDGATTTETNHSLEDALEDYTTNDVLVAKEARNSEYSQFVGVKTNHPQVGSNVKPVYVDSTGKIVVSDGTVGSSVKPIYLDNVEIKVSSGTVGGVKKFIYLDNGELKVSSGSEGNSNRPIYLDNGELKASSSNIGGTKQLVYLSSGVFTASNGNEGDVKKPIYLKDGVLTAFDSTSAVGGATQPIYINSSGEFVVCDSYPAVNNGQIIIKRNGTLVQTFSANQSSNLEADIAVPTDTGDLTNNAGYIKNGGDPTFNTVTAVTFYASSDERLKENIKDSNLGLDLINKLSVKEYNFKSDEKKQKNIGIIAQELQEVLPDDVKDFYVKEDKDGYLGVNDSKLIYVLVNAVKELSKEIEELKKSK